MWRPVGFSSASRIPILLAGAAVAIAAIAGCAIDRSRKYDGPQATLICPDSPTVYDVSPTISRDARIVAWVRVGTDSSGTIFRILRWDRSMGSQDDAAAVDTIWTSSTVVNPIDLSPDGNRLIGTASYFHLVLWSRWTGGRQIDPPLGYDVLYPRWADSTSILFGDDGPEGRGIYSWNVVTDRVVPMLTRFSDRTWSGTPIGLDRAGERICMEEYSSGYGTSVAVYDRNGVAIYRRPAAGHPQFWNIVPGEPEGLLFLNTQGILWGTRLAAGEAPFAILHNVQEYDVSQDGGWIAAKAEFGPNGTCLVIAPARDIR